MSHEGIRISSREEQEREAAEQRALPRSAVTPEKVRVLLSEGKGLEIDWQDGHRSAWSFAWLRAACPCATCVEERTQEGRKPGETKAKAAAVLPLYTPPAKPRSAHAVGRYAIQFDWMDGHSAGIYSWEYLRRMCRCEECTRAAGDDQPSS
jgi:DUF971 family protein